MSFITLTQQLPSEVQGSGLYNTSKRKHFYRDDDVENDDDDTDLKSAMSVKVAPTSFTIS